MGEPRGLGGRPPLGRMPGGLGADMALAVAAGAFPPGRASLPLGLPLTGSEAHRAQVLILKLPLLRGPCSDP